MKTKKTMPKNKKIVLIAVSAVVLAGLIFGASYLVRFLNYERKVEAIQVQNVDLTTIADGEYFGDCDADFVRAKVRVVVQNHVITEVELVEHFYDRGAAASALPSRIVAEQRVDVDTIAGATSSSNVIREAVYNALTGKRTV